MSKSLNKLLSAALLENGYALSPAMEGQLLHFLELLQKWNRVFNLTSIDKPEDQVYLHILDSLAIYPYLKGKRLLDVGSGGGLPGLPLAIIDPEKTWVLLDKSQKKTRFLLQAAAELGLKNVTVACSRCEDFQAPACFDSIISRAFGTIALLIEGTKHLLCKEGQFLAMKGNYPEQEIAEIPAEFSLLDVKELKIAGLEAKRHLVRIEENRGSL